MPLALHAGDRPEKLATGSPKGGTRMNTHRTGVRAIPAVALAAALAATLAIAPLSALAQAYPTGYPLPIQWDGLVCDDPQINPDPHALVLSRLLQISHLA